MARYEDYVKTVVPAGGIDDEILDSAAQQTARQTDATQDVNWEQRYGELEKLNSRQAQTLGDYRKTIDNFITSPTPEATTLSEPLTPITSDDLFNDPSAAINQAVASHPAVLDAIELKASYERDKQQASLDNFAERHEDYMVIAQTPEFQNWVADNPTRTDLFQRGNQYDFSAADALFSLYKAEQGLTQVNQANEIAQAELVSSSGEIMNNEPVTYSRAQYVNTLKRAKQGDLEAEDWVKANVASYRIALGNGQVRD